MKRVTCLNAKLTTVGKAYNEDLKMARGKQNMEQQNTPVETEPVYKVQELKQQQKVLDLDTNDEATITVVTKKIVFAKDATVEQKMAALEVLVSPEEKRIEALAKYFESASYQESKELALSKGNYLSSQLKSQITGIMGNLPAFADNSAKDNFERWLAGYKAGKQSAITLLDRAKVALAGTEFADL